MKLHFDREWLERAIELEGDHEIGAGFEICEAPPGFLTSLIGTTISGECKNEMDAEIRKFLGQETSQDIVDDVSRRFAADLNRIFGEEPSAPGGTGPIKGEDA